jgi:Xaa-Pro aminopeptidase
MVTAPRPEHGPAEPGIYVHGLGGFRHDDSVVVGVRPEFLTKAPKDLKSRTILR